MAKQMNICGTKGSYAFLGEVQPKMLEIGKVYFCVIEELNNEEEWQQVTELCKVVDSGLKGTGATLVKEVEVFGQKMEVTSKAEKGPKKAVWFIRGMQEQKSFLLHQLPKCQFFGPLNVEVEN